MFRHEMSNGWQGNAEGPHPEGHVLCGCGLHTVQIGLPDTVHYGGHYWSLQCLRRHHHEREVGHAETDGE